MSEPNRMECYITLNWKGLPGTNTLAYLVYIKLSKMRCCEHSSLKPYSQHFILYVTYDKPNKHECYNTLGLKGLPGTNTLAYSFLLISYKNEVL
jgi:hypothetical protein